MSNISPQQTLFDIITDDNRQLNQLIYDEINSDVALVKQVASYIIQGGGKRLRSKVLILMAKALGYEGNKHIILAAIIEFIHVATLLHDDVVDQSDVRRGQPSVNAEFNNPAAVLVGDFLYSRAFQLMTKVDNSAVFKILADTTNRISEGEVMQLMYIGDSTLSEEDYFAIINRKTACLFEASCCLSAVVADVSGQQLEQCKKYGHALGMAFQIVDDMLDYTADEEEIGKSLGDDLKEGKMTLPLILLIKHGSDEHKEIVKQAIAQFSENNLSEVIQAIKESNVMERAHKEVEKYTSQALEMCDNMPDNGYTQALRELTIQAMGRTN